MNAKRYSEEPSQAPKKSNGSQEMAIHEYFRNICNELDQEYNALSSGDKGKN